MLPVTEHIRARHAVWGARLVCALAQPQPPVWAVAAHGALAPFSHACHPLALLAWRPTPLERTCLSAPLLRLCDGLAALPFVQDISDAPLQPGPWCATALLWHNPLLPAADRVALAADFQDLAGTGITTVAELGAAAAAATSAIGRTEFLHALAVHLPGSGAAFTDHSRTCAQLHDRVERLPTSWVVEAMAGNLPPATAFAALALPRLGWRFPGGPVQIQALSVREATWAQLGRIGEQRQHRHARFVSHVLIASNCPAPSSERDQAAVLKHLRHSYGSCPGTTSIRRIIGDSLLMLCPQPLACTMLILVSVGSPVRIGSTIFGHALWLRVCWLCSLITLNLGACFQLFCYPCMSCWRSHHLRGCMLVSGGWCA